MSESLVGTWRLVDASARDGDGKPLPKPYGPLGMGIVTLSANGRMLAVLCDGRADLPAGATREYASYCGNYTFDGTTLVTKVDASAVARIAIGGEQVRKVRLDGDRMVLLPPLSQRDGVTQQREIHWERISATSA